MIRPIGSTIGFAVLWVILWRDLSIANVLSGLVVGVVVTTLPRRDQIRHRVRPLAVLRFLGVFAVKLVEANIELAREVVTPTNSINTGIVAVPIPVESDAVVTLVASAVSLTPGTLTLETTPCPDPVLYVHVLHLRDIDHARDEVLGIARLAAAAFPLRSPRADATSGGGAS